MSHYTVMLKLKMEGSLTGIERAIEEVLEPYSENIEVEEYPDENYTMEKIIKDIEEVIEKVTGNECPGYLKKYKEEETLKLLRDVAFTNKLEGYESVLKRYRKELNEKFIDSWCGKEIREDGKIYTTYNPDSKWDWFSIGGRWEGQLIKHDGTTENIAYIKDLDLEKMCMPKENAQKLWKEAQTLDKPGRYFEYGIENGETQEEFIARKTQFYTFAVLDEDGWHERAKMGWFGTAHNETESESDWATKFKERFLENYDDDDVVVIVDCHI